MSPDTFLLFLFGAVATWAFIMALLVLHELGHIYAMRKLGLKVDKVVMGVQKMFTVKVAGVPVEFGLLPAVAYCVSEDFKRTDSNRRAWVALAGPVATVVTGVVFYALFLLTQHWTMQIAVQGSVILFLTNIIPLPPLDGWTVVEHFLIRRGIVIEEAERKKLFMIGIATILLVAMVV